MKQDADKIIHDAFMNSVNTFSMHEEGHKSHYDSKYNINLNSILTKLIQDTGRFCERFASDLIIDWDAIRNAVNESEFDELPHTQVFAIGIRENGVDDNSYVVSRMKGSWNPETYRRIYGVAVQHDCKDSEMTVRVELRDIKSEIDLMAYRMYNERQFGN